MPANYLSKLPSREQDPSKALRYLTIGSHPEVVEMPNPPGLRDGRADAPGHPLSLV